MQNECWRMAYPHQNTQYTIYPGEYYWAFSRKFWKFWKLLQKGSQDQVLVPGWSIKWFPGGQLRMEQVLERWRLVHHTKVLVLQGCAPPYSAWHEVWVPGGSINWFHCGWLRTELILENRNILHDPPPFIE